MTGVRRVATAPGVFPSLGRSGPGIGAILAILWEISEWFGFIRWGTELATAYTDTIGDLALGTLGAFTAGLLTVWFARRREAVPVPA
jgi:hypothetical protein